MSKRKPPDEDPWEGFFDAPENKEWVDHVKNELIPMIQRSGMTISLIPNDPRNVDIKFAVELGLSIMLDKPIIAVVSPGVQIPNQLLKLAEHIVEWDDEPTEASRNALIERIHKIIEQQRGVQSSDE